VNVHGGKEVRGRAKERRRSEEGRKTMTSGFFFLSFFFPLLPIFVEVKST